MKIIRAERHDHDLTLTFDDGHQITAPALWLRDNCTCAECRHPVTNQRLITALALDAEPVVVEISAGETLSVQWAGEGHLSTWAAAWLREHLGPPAPTEPVLWDGGLSLDEIQVTHGSAAEDADVLRLLDTHGVAWVRGASTAEGTVTGYTERFGFVRETNYGRLFDVVAVADAEHLAYTGVALALHTDNPYRRPAPGIQVLHCLESSAEGGDTLLVDGFRVANDLRARHPDAFDTLVRLPASFRYRDKQCDLRERRALIRLDEDGDLQAIHFNDRSMAPLRLSAADTRAFYQAYRVLAAMMNDPSYLATFRLEPGDVLVFDNERVLHGRTAFSLASGRRHLQGCYADRDAFASRRRVLAR